MRNILIASASVLLGGGMFVSAALAQDATDDLDVSLTVEPSCTISVAALDFGSISTLTTGASDVQSTADISVTCTTDAPYELGLGLGTHALTTQRRLFNSTATGNAYVSYNLYSDDQYSDPWGVTQNTDTVGDTGDGTAQVHTIYGEIPSGQAVSLGDYTDTVVATVWYGTDLTP